MKALDRYLQRKRINKVRPYLTKGARVLDIGCASGALFEQAQGLGDSIGLDPDLPKTTRCGPALLIKGNFPGDLPDERPFDAITMLAVLEHIPPDQQPTLASNCAKYLKPGGVLLMTVPDPKVDQILDGLMFLRVIDGMEVGQHYEFDVTQTPGIFATAGLSLVAARKFQLGLNNLFVFQKNVHRA